MTANIINTGDKIEMVAAGKLACHPDNPRRGDVDSIRESISTNGFYGALVVQRSTGHILAGNHRFMAAQAERFEKFPVIYVDVDDEEAKYILVVDNRSSDKAENDQEILAAILQGLESSEQGLIGSGYSDADLAGLLAAVMADGEALEGEDDIPETPEEPVTRPGDLWILGNHRLICGDATVATDVERLLGTVKPLLMVTDPPYVVEYDPSWRNQAGATATKRIGKVLNDDRADWHEAWALFPGDVAYVWHGALHAATVAESLEEAGFKVRSQIIWAKERLVLSRGDYHWQHEPCQPAGTMVQKVTERGSGSQPAQIEDVPIETLKVGDFVVSYNSYESVVRRRGRKITRFGSRQFVGFMHQISAAGRVTRATPEHRFSVRLNPDAADKQVVYLMRRGDWWRVGRVRLFNSRGFGLATRLADNKAEEAWVISVHDTACEAQCVEQILSCKYGIPTTHWEIDNWAKKPDHQRSAEMIANIYSCLDLSALSARATLLLRDHRLEREHPFITNCKKLMFSRKATRRVRACNVFASIMQIPIPTTGDEFDWVTVTGNDAAPFSGQVYSMDVDKDQHYVADGLITHNCWYAVKKTGKGHWAGDRKQTTLWQIPSRDQDSVTIHGTQKPVECMRRPILNNSSPGQVVYEPFMGSGTTLIAAESTGRVCCGSELSPAYVDVAILRWQNITGEKAILDGDGRSFEEIKEGKDAA